MATAPAAQSSRAVWHIRGTWSPREDRVPSAVWLGILWIGMIAGFGKDMSRFAHQNPPTILWVHGAVFTVWMLLLTAQVTLVLGNRVAWHRKMGWFAVGWACLMAVMGPIAPIAALMPYVKSHGPVPDPFMSLHLVDLGGFLVLLAWGISLRKNPAAHKRMMILATISLADPGFNRFIEHLVKEPASVFPWFLYAFYGNILLILFMAAWDWWRGRLVRSFVIGATALLATEYVASFLYFWKPWSDLTFTWVKALARLNS